MAYFEKITFGGRRQWLADLGRRGRIARSSGIWRRILPRLACGGVIRLHKTFRELRRKLSGHGNTAFPGERFQRLAFQ